MSGLEPLFIGLSAAAAAGSAGASIYSATKDPPKPPEIPPPPKEPDPRSIDRLPAAKAAARGSRQNQTMLGGYSRTERNASRPTLLGGTS